MSTHNSVDVRNINIKMIGCIQHMNESVFHHGQKRQRANRTCQLLITKLINNVARNINGTVNVDRGIKGVALMHTITLLWDPTIKSMRTILNTTNNVHKLKRCNTRTNT